MRTDVVAVKAELNRREQIKQQLLDAYPELAEDDQTLLDTLDGESNFDDMMVALAKASKEREAMAAACNKLAADYKDRAGRHAAAREALRKTIIWAMTTAGKRKLKHALVSLSISDLEDKIEIIEKDPNMVDDEFVTEEVVRKVDMEKIAKNLQEAVDAGVAVIHYDRKSINIRV